MSTSTPTTSIPTTTISTYAKALTAVISSRSKLNETLATLQKLPEDDAILSTISALHGVICQLNEQCAKYQNTIDEFKSKIDTFYAIYAIAPCGSRYGNSDVAVFSSIENAKKHYVKSSANGHRECGTWNYRITVVDHSQIDFSRLDIVPDSNYPY